MAFPLLFRPKIEHDFALIRPGGHPGLFLFWFKCCNTRLNCAVITDNLEL